MVKTYSAAAVFLLCRMKSPVFSLGMGVDILSVSLSVSLGGSAPLSRLGLRLNPFSNLPKRLLSGIFLSRVVY